MNGGWEIWVDTGGTFTDALGRDPAGDLHRIKVLSSSALRGTVEAMAGPDRMVVATSFTMPRDFPSGFRFRLLGNRSGQKPLVVLGYEPLSRVLILDRPTPPATAVGDPFELLCPDEAPVLAARLLTGAATGTPLPVDRFRLATTLGTNTLLQRKGAPTALFVTEGLADLLEIGTQARPCLFTLDIRKRLPLYQVAVEVPGRLGPAGEEELPLDLEEVEGPAIEALAAGCRTAAVALMHSYRNPNHERQVREFLLERGFEHVSCSSDLAPAIRILPRAETAVVDASLAPVVKTYLDRVAEALSVADLHVMTSAGGLVSPADYHPKDSLLSGPAGGVVGAAYAGRQAGFEKLLSFDMGGTSTDVARFDGDYEYVFEHRIADAHLVAPALAIESVAAGGSSVCWFDGDRIRVGPQSAGADPGPACYGAGGPLTLTDVNLLLGRIESSLFQIPIDGEAAETALRELLEQLEQAGRRSRRLDLLSGLLAIADERMADATRQVSLRRGYDPAEYTLVAFGGAGPQHACGVASRLGVRRVVVPPDTGLLSADGLGRAVMERFAFRQVLEQLEDCRTTVPDIVRNLEEEASQALASEGVKQDEMEIRRRIAELRFTGQDSSLEVEMEGAGPIENPFLERYRARYGHLPSGRQVELVSVKVVAAAMTTAQEASLPCSPARQPEPPSPARFHLGAALFHRSDLVAGQKISGPALVLEPHSVTVVDTGWDGAVHPGGALILERRQISVTAGDGGIQEACGAVRLELFTHRFETIAKEMGEQLRRTAVSTNIKERLDFSCAVLDPDGELLVNAPHIPVHLGALGLCVRSVLKVMPLQPGDVVITNHPGYGGSHLPDVTVITPVHAGELIGYVASRAHHAELGGARPGSMPPSATCLAEEGVVIPPMKLVEGGRPRWEKMEELLAGGRFPSRSVEDNLADLRAAVAANHAGSVALVGLAERAGRDTVLYYMQELKRLAASRLRAALSGLDDGEYRAVERLDDGTELAVTITLRGDRAVLDFTGSGMVHPGNLNATPAIVHGVVIFFLRLLIKESIPLNEGFLHPVQLVIPNGILNPIFHDDPELSPAVVGGNVETSQRLVDTLVRALGIAACSQGTMNNVLFGTDHFGYYETVCGGCGAGPGFHGAGAVHSNMTNTRITDPEILEQRYPVRVERFAVRRGSGGGGDYRGGDGVVRILKFLAPMSLSVLTQHRVERPFGLNGGEPGMAGRQQVKRADGSVLELKSVDGVMRDTSTQVVPQRRFNAVTAASVQCPLTRRNDLAVHSKIVTHFDRKKDYAQSDERENRYDGYVLCHQTTPRDTML